MFLKKKDITPTQLYGSGLAAILICLLLHVFLGKVVFLHLAIGLTVLSMVWTLPVRYFAVIWFAFGEMLGYVVSRVLLTIIFLIVVFPVSLFVRKSIRRRMSLSLFKAGSDSVFKNREHPFTASDFEKPF